MDKNIYCFFLLFFIHIPSFSDDSCKQWFEQGRISTESSDCLIKCASLVTDMGTFHCPDECDNLCRSSTREKLLFRYVYYPALTKAERALIAKYPKKAYIAYKQKHLATSRTDFYFPRGLVNDESDAFRHFIWAGLLRKELGLSFAQMFLDAHENNIYQTETEKAMDLANNRAGLLESERLEKQKKLNLKNLEKVALKYLREQKLVVLKKRLAIPNGVKK